MASATSVSSARGLSIDSGRAKRLVSNPSGSTSTATSAHAGQRQHVAQPHAGPFGDADGAGPPLSIARLAPEAVLEEAAGIAGAFEGTDDRDLWHGGQRVVVERERSLQAVAGQFGEPGFGIGPLAVLRRGEQGVRRGFDQVGAGWHGEELSWRG